MIRAVLAEDAPNGRWLALLLSHHLVSDHTTLETIAEEARAQLAGASSALTASPPFRDFVARARLGVGRAAHEAFFRDRLADVEEPTAPFGLTEVWADGSQTAEARIDIDPALALRLRRQARLQGVSAASLFHLAFALCSHASADASTSCSEPCCSDDCREPARRAPPA